MAEALGVEVLAGAAELAGGGGVVAVELCVWGERMRGKLGEERE